MRSSVSYTALVAVLVTAAGCASLDSGDQSNRYARLPTGVTLLETESGRCAGTVQVSEERNGRSSNSELVLRPGENATFAVDFDDDEELEWSCVGEERSVAREVDCPDDTTHVRITRRADGGDLALECYGRDSDRRTSRNDR